MIPKLARYGLVGAIAALLATPSAANEEADRAIRQRKWEAYAAEIVAKYPAQKAYFIHNKTPRDQGLADEVYAALKKSGKDAFLYDSFPAGDLAVIQEKDWRSVEQADVVFCGCTAPEAKAVRATVTKQGFTGQFVALSEPQ